MIIDFRLNVFIAVVRLQSFTKAAVVLNISQPAVSKHIKELEVDIGEPLFNRQGNRISLTDRAKALVPLVETILDGYQALNDVIDRDQNRFEGVVNIGASTTIAQYVLPEILAKFSKEYPSIKLSIRSANSEEVIDMLLSKEVEIALIEGDSSSSAVHYSSLADDKIVLVSTKKHTRSLAIDEIERLPLLIREEGSGTLSVVMSALKNRGLGRKNLNIKMQLGSSEAILRYLKASRDYAFISILIAKEYIERGDLYVSSVEGLDITRKFRFASLHGHSGRLTALFQSFCKIHYNF